jgi:hypothetical protein
MPRVRIGFCWFNRVVSSLHGFRLAHLRRFGLPDGVSTFAQPVSFHVVCLDVVGAFVADLNIVAFEVDSNVAARCDHSDQRCDDK